MPAPSFLTAEPGTVASANGAPLIWRPIGKSALVEIPATREVSAGPVMPCHELATLYCLVEMRMRNMIVAGCVPVIGRRRQVPAKSHSAPPISRCGMAGIVATDSVMTLRRLYFATPSRFYAAGAARVAMGLVLILAASNLP
jgi:hypothetical protein